MKERFQSRHSSILHSPFFIFFLLLEVPSIFTHTCDGENFSKFPAVLIFGDSTVDTGNNNYITTAIKGNHYPYGKDFPGGIPTGRFSNGKLAVDFLVSLLGIKEAIPPFLQPNLPEYELRTGVTFASAGAGYDSLTSAITKGIPMSQQLNLFRDYREILKKIVGEEEAWKIIGKALFTVSAGTNDFVFNFYDIPTRRIEFNIDGYQDFILNKLPDFIKELYDLGCRRLVITGLPPVGCLPTQITAKLKGPFGRKCVEQQNVDAQNYNRKLTGLLPQIQASLQGSRVLYADIYKPIMDMIENPEKYGFSETAKGCCGTGLLEAGPLCTPLTPLCLNSSKYLFFDSIHPGETAYHYVTERLKKEILSKF